MNRQNDELFNDNASGELYSDSSHTAEHSVQDKAEAKPATVSEVDDFIFLKPGQHKKKVKKRRSTYTCGDDIVVRSTTSNRKTRHHKKHRRRAKMKRWKKVLIAIASTLFALVLILVITVVSLFYRGSQELFNSEIAVSAPEGVTVQENGKYVVYNGETYEFNENITNMLFMGVDKREIDGEAQVKGTGGQADVLLLASIDTSTGKITLVNISRDTMTDVTVYSAGGSYVGSEKQQLCLAYAYGDGKETSCENTVDSVTRLFYNIPVNTYFALDLDGISAINDSIGGVDVVSPETIDGFVQGQSYHLTDGQAESFVRARDTNKLDSNNMRMQRQQIYMESFINTAIEQTKKDLGTPMRLYNESAEYSCTNLNPSRVSYLAGMLVTNGSMKIDMVSVPGNVTQGEKFAEFNVDEKSFYEMFLNIYYNKI